MATHSACMPTLLILATLTACASSPPQTARAVAVAVRTPSARWVPVTGSRLPVPVDSSTGLSESYPALQVVSQVDIALTGQTQVGAALRQLVPAFQ